MKVITSNAVIGKNIKDFRERMGLTQESLGQFLGVAREQISYYESGNRSVPSTLMTKLADLFCVNEYDFYEEDLQTQRLNLAFAFRANCVNQEDLESIAQFKKIVRNYLNMQKVIVNG